MEKEVVVYQTRDGREPFSDWLEGLSDKSLQQRIWVRLNRVQYGNYGDHKRFHGIIELRLHFGKGYRIYCGEDDGRLIVVLAGGDKSSQDRDIQQVFIYWRDYYDQKKI